MMAFGSLHFDILLQNKNGRVLSVSLLKEKLILEAFC